jgi:hypothetical protein
MLAISCGYPDVNDFDWLRCDAAFNLACGRLPETAVTFGGPISRFSHSRPTEFPGATDFLLVSGCHLEWSDFTEAGQIGITFARNWSTSYRLFFQPSH